MTINKIDSRFVENKGNGKSIRDEIDETNSLLAQTTSNILNVNRSWGVVGDGLSDDTNAIQNAINFAINKQMDVFIPAGKYLISNDIKIENANDMNIEVQKGAEFYVGGDFDGIDIYPQSNKIPLQRAFFAIIDSENVLFSGGIYECEGFTHPGDGRAASAILVLRSESITVENTRVYNLAPNGVWGATSDSGIEIRYTGILGIKTKSLTIRNNYAHTIAYAAYETRIGCDDTKVINNYAENCAEHLTQCTVRYGQADVSELVEGDRHNRNVLVMGNTAKGETTDITVHSENTSIIGNTLIDVTSERSISFRGNGKGIVCTGNTFICTNGKGDSCFQISGGEDIVIKDNVINNYSKLFTDAFGNAILGNNVFIDVDDVGKNNTVNGRNAAKSAQGDYLTVFGREAVEQTVGDWVTAFGYRAGRQSENSNSLTAFGRESGKNNKGIDDTFVGDRSGNNNNGSRVTGVGRSALNGNTQNNATAIGYQAGSGNDGLRSTFIGKDAGLNNTGDDAILIGNETGVDNSFQNVVGLGVTPDDNNQYTIGNRHLDMRDTPEPSTPNAGRARMWVNSNRLFIKFDDGTVVRIADNL